MISRRTFNHSLVALAFAGLSRHLLAFSAEDAPARTGNFGYGELKPDPAGILDLPEGFSYRIISSLGETMSDGQPVPDRADGMGCFHLDEERVVLVRNHELFPMRILDDQASNEITDSKALASPLAYDSYKAGEALPGGTTNIVYNLKQRRVEKQFRSLIGTIRNCSGGVTPWNTWLTCEESVEKASDKISRDHGYVFEVPANAKALVAAKPIKAMGRFNHEAACVDPRSGIVYLTEDRDDSLLYRYIPNTPGDLHKGGKLQALAINGQPKFDSRNWVSTQMPVKQPLEVNWIDLSNVESPADDLRLQGQAKGAAVFARGEGIHWATNELYFCCTSGGAKKVGQIMRYVPSAEEGQQAEASSPGKLELFVESPDAQTFNYGDNITVAPNGHLLVCEDQYTDVVDNHLRGVTPEGQVYDFAKVHVQTEPAGACFSPDGSTLFVNLYSPATTLAITGPWENLQAQL